ncbi:MAG: hypothetical protein K9N51_07240 [Candidatus Pacebacteria bacterium]|nr:hypothetical protein [Candidatus Paceibacterota bacterium]
MRLHVPKFIARDFSRKFVATFFAVLIWLAVSNQLHDFETFHDVPVSLRYPADKLFLDRKIETATVTLRGARRRLEDLQSSDITLAARIPVVPEGVYYYDLHLSADDVNEPPGTKVTSITPENIRVQLDRIVSKDVPVRVRESGEPGYGYKIVERTVVPSTVTIAGPSKIVNEIDDIMTEAVILDESLVENFEMDEVRLIPIPRVDVSPKSVHIAYEVARHSGQKAFTDLPIRILKNKDSALQVKGPLPKAQVTVRGSKSVLDALKDHAVRPFVDITSVSSPGRYTFPVNAWVEGPSRVTVEYVHPPDVDVVIAVGGTDSPPPAPKPEDKNDTSSDSHHAVPPADTE